MKEKTFSKLKYVPAQCRLGKEEVLYKSKGHTVKLSCFQGRTPDTDTDTDTVFNNRKNKKEIQSRS